ncbi:MAG: ABC transporter ATP-binding protein [Chloroflexi bacterium]|nr:ABC transporter ATP-binding protein [Chloroflexota bacterium]
MFAVRFENVSKVYKIGRQRQFTQLFAAWAGKAVGKESGRPKHWALNDVSFELQEGDSLGMLGSNGAGKTTILKLLSRVTWPTAGRVLVAGKVISLIELGAGFHAELTGRENIFLHGAILGLSFKEIASRLDEIVTFTGIEKFVDTPVKWYSSGMYARLGFGVAAHSDPDVLLVDEVLAVGDTAFQRKAIDAMRGLVQSGKTVILVSHDLGNVRGLCKQVLWLEKGEVKALGPTDEIVAQYLDDVNARAAAEQGARDRTETRGGSGDARFTTVQLLDHSGRQTDVFQPGEPIRIRAAYKTFRPLERPIFRVLIRAPRFGVSVCAGDTHASDIPETVDGEGVLEAVFDGPPIQPGLYSVALEIRGPDGVALYDSLGVAADFMVPVTAGSNGYVVDRDDLVRVPVRFEHVSGLG